jgi:hypothetical protein
VLGWDPRFEEWRCNWCVTETVGKDELGKRLLGVWKYVTGVEIMRLEFDVKIGWGAVSDFLLFVSWVPEILVIPRANLKHLQIDEAEWIKVFKKARVESQLWRKIPTPDDIQVRIVLFPVRPKALRTMKPYLKQKTNSPPPEDRRPRQKTRVLHNLEEISPEPGTNFSRGNRERNFRNGG